MSKERFQQLAAFVIALLTAIAAVIGYLQADAGSRDDRGNRDSKRYSIEAFSKEVSGSARVNFDYGRVYQAYNELLVEASSAETHGEPADAEIYRDLAEEMRSLSPLLKAPYFDDKSMSEPDVARYETDTYVVDVTRLNEQFKAADAVKQGWDYKANTYIVHLTILAVALFLWGLAATIASSRTRPIFALAGTGVALWATLWAGYLYVQPVYDLRAAGKAIDDYAQAMGLEHRADAAEEAEAKGLREQALKLLDSSLGAAPDFLDALRDRGLIRREVAQFEPAAQDLEKARALDPGNAELAGQLAETWLDAGKLDLAKKAIQEAMALKADEPWLILDAALIELQAGRVKECQTLVAQAEKIVAESMASAATAKEEPPTELLQALADGAVDFEELALDLEAGKGPKVGNAKEVQAAADALATELAGHEMALEYTGKPLAGKSAAKIEEIEFTETSEDGEHDLPPAEEFGDHVSQISAHFDYQGMQDGQSVIFRIYRNGLEETSWRVVSKWDGGASGSYEQVLSPGYTETFTFEPGEYEVELYVDFHLVASGAFKVK